MPEPAPAALRLLGPLLLALLAGCAGQEDPPTPPPADTSDPSSATSVTAANGWIAFTAYQPRPGDGEDDLDIWFAALDQEARRVIGTDTDDVIQLCPAFSPDGRSLAYGQVERDGTEYVNAALVVADVSDEGTVADRLTVDVGEGLPPPCPVWSPDAGQVAFGEARTSPMNPRTSPVGSEVWIVTLADQAITVLPDLLATDLEWSPDGSLLAIVAVTDGLGDAQILLYEPSTGALRTLDDTLGVNALTWSPDGDRIAYAGGRPADGDDSHQALRIIDVETGRQEVLTSTYQAVHGVGPVWSPDGETIAYQRMVRASGESHEVVLVTPDDRSEQTGLASEVVMPIQRTTADGSDLWLFPWRVTWSPDSTYLSYVAWTYPTATSEQTVVVAVPTDQDAPAVVVADTPGIAAYGILDDNMRVPIQIWGRGPSE